MKLKRKTTLTVPNTEEGRAWADWYKRTTEIHGQKVRKRTTKNCIILSITEKTKAYAWQGRET